jgi:chorismate lyase/3-hydroxybenzoate synthase
MPEPFLIDRTSGNGQSLLRVCFNPSATKACFDITAKCLTLPLQSTTPSEPFALQLPDAEPITSGPITYWRDDNTMLGVACVTADPELLEPDSYSLYRSLISACEGLNLYRIWNWVPDINRNAPRQDENYRLFCAGRARAFQDAFAGDPETKMPAASAVGLIGNDMVSFFLAGTAPVEHGENPRQIPAYRYPKTYGTYPPSFARITHVKLPQPWTFIAGTASIIESETQCPSDLEGQLQVTLENLRLLGVENKAKRFFRVYVRDWQNQQSIGAFLEKHLLQPGDTVSFVETELCRTDLLVEIEASFQG